MNQKCFCHHIINLSYVISIKSIVYSEKEFVLSLISLIYSENKSFSSSMYNLFAEHLQINEIIQD